MENEKPITVPLEKRLPAFLIDMIPVCLVQASLMVPFIMLPLMQKQIQANQVISRNLLITAVASIFIIFRDVFGGRSIGKRVMKLRVSSAADKQAIPSVGRLVLRNIFVLIWPVEALLLLSGKVRLGDRMSKTSVINIGGTA